MGGTWWFFLLVVILSLYKSVVTFKVCIFQYFCVLRIIRRTEVPKQENLAWRIQRLTGWWVTIVPQNIAFQQRGNIL